jgi:ABC-type glycerol-3-phosphate transport system permease component
VIWTILVALNLFCAVAGYSFLAYALARLRWCERGVPIVVIAIIISAQTWFIPQLLCGFILKLNLLLDWCWFGNWLVCAFGIVLLWHALKHVPSDRADAARIDGCGAFGIYWHVVLPLVRPALLFLAIFVLIANGGFLLARTSQIVRPAAPPQDLALLLGVSVAATLPLIAIFFLATQFFPARKHP